MSPSVRANTPTWSSPLEQLESPVARDHAVRRFAAVDSTVGGRLYRRAVGLGADGKRHHRSSDCSRRTRRRAAGRACWIVWIPCRAGMEIGKLCPRAARWRYSRRAHTRAAIPRKSVDLPKMPTRRLQLPSPINWHCLSDAGQWAPIQRPCFRQALLNDIEATWRAF